MPILCRVRVSGQLFNYLTVYVTVVVFPTTIRMAGAT